MVRGRRGGKRNKGEGREGRGEGKGGKGGKGEGTGAIIHALSIIKQLKLCHMTILIVC